MTFARFLRTFGFLKEVPLLPWLVDGVMQVHTALFRSVVARAIDDVEREVVSWPGVSIGLHKYGGLQFNLGHQELGHIHGNGLADLCYCRRHKAALLASGLAADHHTLPHSGWMSCWMRREADAAKVIYLFRQVYEWRSTSFGAAQRPFTG